MFVCCFFRVCWLKTIRVICLERFFFLLLFYAVLLFLFSLTLLSSVGVAIYSMLITYIVLILIIIIIEWSFYSRRNVGPKHVDEYQLCQAAHVSNVFVVTFHHFVIDVDDCVYGICDIPGCELGSNQIVTNDRPQLICNILQETNRNTHSALMVSANCWHSAELTSFRYSRCVERKSLQLLIIMFVCLYCMPSVRCVYW